MRIKRKRTPATWLDDVQHMQVSLEIQDAVIRRQLEMIGLSANELKIAKAIQPLVLQHRDEIVSAFYTAITDVDHLKNIIIQHSTLDRLRRTLTGHLAEMFSGQLNQQFLDKRIRIANIHYKIGLEPKWYISAFQNLQVALLRAVHRHVEDRDEYLTVNEVITKILNFEQQLVLEAYEKQNARQRQLQYDEIKAELKAKIISVGEELARIVQSTNKAVHHLVINSDTVNESVLRGADASRETRNLSKDGQEKLHELSSRVISTFEQANDLKNIMGHLNTAIQEIGTVIRLVQSIADQTNLLSLNSSIEAARAGKHGAGFAVVSHEIRKLSAQTKESLDQIKRNIDAAHHYTAEVESVIAGMHRSLEDGKRESEAVNDSFHRILDSMTASLDSIEYIEKGMEILVHHVQTINEAMENVSQSTAALYAAIEKL